MGARGSIGGSGALHSGAHQRRIARKKRPGCRRAGVRLGRRKRPRRGWPTRAVRTAVKKIRSVTGACGWPFWLSNGRTWRAEAEVARYGKKCRLADGRKKASGDLSRKK